MSSVFKHWGEIENKKTVNYVPDVSADIEKSMSKFCLAEFDADVKNGEENIERLVLQPMDPLMLHSIALHKHANDMNEKIRVAELAVEMNVIPPADAVPPIPQPPKIIRKHVQNCLNFIPLETTPFNEGLPVEYPELSSAVIKEILSKCVATMFAQIGYKTTHNSVLLLLTDVLDEFLKKICAHFKRAREEEVADGLGGFPCFPEKVLIELGMGGMKGLHDYYQNRVIKYINVLQKRCEDLNEHYEKLLVPRDPSPIDKINKVVRVVEEDVVEMHFPGIEGEAGFSSLETGFQLLNSLEAETHLGESEEMNVSSASPGVLTESENLSPFAKKKRVK